ncbi:MAG: hypothetical protein UX08_C0013G0027 [Candidatus Collierbacteria bacterium GW2011_GWB1_45_35]|uniref:Uncharacterized protein n=2 Tax=Candidatus Collieribacteriota TaxID=1752725 RepID=A0A0G1N0X4_9BACT|nr:MAG: hypothetical protein UW48_C0008G0027 [Microgenomates group bacterium GW2011_GWC1_44_23]KKT86697.1 MAG: hypothetical protein UW84_C0004G0012 [Candidatus Collierbacteria bacterium GW2011_GWA2_44_99]KKT95360.1 MAG: hypothetical protein UW96_C0008G0027 [Candidatus Collierbacteria bacterium GW2011_GWA1_45_15]KKT99589.1 MAG: hypothetical protein UX01_C0009G0019 [Candidatus Collierbacteria bacterium GW2011_GWB2_45_17]KKU04937.1 MAG: hypothetical protein UX08_C0013G0027 [Candidatus Collierbacte
MATKTQTLDIPGVLSRMVLTPKSKTGSVSKLSERLEKIDTDVFFGFENVDSQLKDLQTATEREFITIEMAKRGFPELDYSFLAWRKKVSKLPAFMVLGLETNEFSVSVEAMRSDIVDLNDIDYEFEPDLPKVIMDQFLDSILYLGKLSANKYDDGEIAITAQFNGVMPAEVRKKTMKVLEDEIFDNIFIICEAPAWNINKTGRTDKKDPLVVGWVDETDQMFLIASFDPTSLEDYVLTQFKK